MPTIDVALFSRVIFLQFNKTEFNETEKKDYEALKQAERDGLSHLTANFKIANILKKISIITKRS